MKTIVRAVGLLFTIALVVYIIIEWRKFTHSAIGKALAKILGDVGAALLWMANHPFLSIIGIILAVLLFPILTGFARGVFTKLKDGTEKLFEKQREGVDDESLKDPDKPADETELKAYEGATIDIVKEKVHKIVSDDPVLIPQEQQDEINARITDAKTTLYKEMKAEDPDIKDDTDAQDLMNEAGEKFGE